MAPAVEVKNLRHTYKEKEVLRGLNFSVERREIFGILGPNGSGKTTLFRVLSTALRASQGSVQMAEFQMPGEENKVREKIGVVFQSPSLDGKLTVRENLMHHGHLYGISGSELARRSSEMLARLGLADRAGQIVDKLSGGLKRRAELAKGLLHRPEILILDEPSTGLDPGARADLWNYLKTLRDDNHVTILVTTHLMEEADRCDRIAILNQGQIVSIGKPEALKREISGDVIVVESPAAEALAKAIKNKFQMKCSVFEGNVQIEHENGATFISKLAGAFPEEISSVTVRKPTLEDVFIHRTGHRFWSAEAVHA